MVNSSSPFVKVSEKCHERLPVAGKGSVRLAVIAGKLNYLSVNVYCATVQADEYKQIHAVAWRRKIPIVSPPTRK